MLFFWVKQESILCIYFHTFHPGLKFNLVLFVTFTFRCNKLREDEVWRYPGGDQRFGAFPNHSSAPVLHSSHCSALSFSPEQLHRRASSSPLRLQLAGERRPLQEFDAGAEANRQHTSQDEWRCRSLWDVCGAPASTVGQYHQQHRAADSSMSEWMDLWQLLRHFLSGNGGTGLYFPLSEVTFTGTFTFWWLSVTKVTVDILISCCLSQFRFLLNIHFWDVKKKYCNCIFLQICTKFSTSETGALTIHPSTCFSGTLSVTGKVWLKWQPPSSFLEWCLGPLRLDTCLISMLFPW